jgi:hypothetical protein
VGLADGNGYGMPITQTALADALGPLDRSCEPEPATTETQRSHPNTERKNADQ